jgi:hypothetical protein
VLLEVLITGVLSVSPLPQGRPVCDIVSEKDAVAVLGSVKKKNTILGADQCVFTTEGLSLMVNRLSGQEPEQVQMMLDLPKNRAKPGDIVKEEPGIGTRAVSEQSKGHLAIIAAQGDTIWSFGVDHVYSKDLSDMLPKLREFAKKVVAAK